MKKIKLNVELEKGSTVDEYRLNPTEKYVINIEEEIEFQTAIMMSFQIAGPPPALKNYHAWLLENGFSVDSPNPTNVFVAPFYGVIPLRYWAGRWVLHTLPASDPAIPTESCGCPQSVRSPRRHPAFGEALPAILSAWRRRCSGR